MVDFSRFGSKKGMTNLEWELENELRKPFNDTDSQVEFNDDQGARLSPAERARAVLDEIKLVKTFYDLTQFEMEFLEGIYTRAPANLSFKQAKVLKEIEKKVFTNKGDSPSEI